jgi:hypothetical protein
MGFVVASELTKVSSFKFPVLSFPFPVDWDGSVGAQDTTQRQFTAQRRRSLSV